MVLKIKIHNAYRNIVALCDAELIGKKFVDEKTGLQLDLKESFYDGKEINEEEAINIIKTANSDDATFNIVGEKAISVALKAGIISKKGIIKVKGIPHALGLL
ncbi:MAG: DUF424 family protein [Candidatus Pacearchaeota archaeon]